MMIRTVRYTLEYTYDPPRGARWRLVEGDLTNVEGSYRFDPSTSFVAVLRSTRNHSLHAERWYHHSVCTPRMLDLL